MIRKLLAPAALAMAIGLNSYADVKLPAVLSDNMVIQQDKPIPVWGWADPGEAITVTLEGQKVTGTADDKGNFLVKLNPIKAAADAKPIEMTVAGKNSITIKNILAGEVWVCSGQSNMGYTFSAAHNASVEGPKADKPTIRLFKVPLKTALTPQKDVQGKWELCTPESVKNFTAVGYFFGRDINKALNLPVGLINTSWGGTPAEAWTTVEGLKSEPALANYVKSYENTATNLQAIKAKYKDEVLPKYEADLKKWNETEGAAQKALMAAWQKEAAAAKAAGKEAPAQPKLKQAPRRPNAPDNNPNVPSVLNNAMIAPLAPLAIRGAIWYQGESNAGQAKLYETLFPTMIKDWRRQWAKGDQGDFGFYWVQLANYMKRETDPVQSEAGWPGLRDAQSKTLALPNTGQAVIIDIGEGDDIHPKNKDTVGQRLALSALKGTYGKDIVSSGPTYQSMSVDGNKAILKFTNVGGGLKIAAAPPIRLNTEMGQALDHLVGFSIAGEDKKFVWANAKIEGDTIVVSADSVKEPKAVRYAWANNPEANLYNKEGLPASPFRTDDWTGSAPPQKK